jgi:hypothetical protein
VEDAAHLFGRMQKQGRVQALRKEHAKEEQDGGKYF